MKILAVGDSFVSTDMFRRGLSRFAGDHQIDLLDLDMDAPFAPTTPSELGLREYAGNPRQLVDALSDQDVLLVHGAPVTDAVMDASPTLRIVGVARGGPVNVDLAAASERGISVVTAPGRNADAVADLTLAFLILLARGVMSSVAFVAGGGRVGESAFEGARFFGHELGGHTLGLVGYGNVGARVAQRARSFGMRMVVYDPYVSSVDGPDVTLTELDDLLARSDFVSLHARVTPETDNFFDAEKFDRMKPGAFFLNTARETLLDEEALYDALASGRVAGAALDVVRPRAGGVPNPLLALPNVVIAPHIGGATFEAALRGVTILAEQIERYIEGEPMRFVANGIAVGGTR